MIPTVRKPFQILLLCFVVLSVYYVSMFSEICLLDDRNVIISLSNTEHIDLKTLFFPHSAKGEYYRPLIGIFYMLDRFVYDLDPRVMHLENIMFHLLNVLLLYLIAGQLHNNNNPKTKYVPLFTALLFSIHPMTTESVNWISGRTDLLACIGVLFATFIMIKYRESKQWWFWPAIVASVIFGMLAKETAIAFFFAAFFLYRMHVDEHNSVGQQDLQLPWRNIVLVTAAFYITAAFVALFTYSYLSVLVLIVGYGLFIYFRYSRKLQRGGIKVWGILGATLLVSAGLFFMIRKSVFTSDVASIPRTLSLIMSDPIYSFKVFTGAIAFYVKEFILPFPLNFAIREIDPLYELLGILILLLILLFIQLAGRVSSLLLAGFCMIAPALPLSLGTVTWTAFAERYVYLAIPFWLLAASICWSRYVAGRIQLQRAATAFVAILLVFWGGLTFKRNLTWQSNLTLFEDTVQKSPNFKVVRGLYMLALYENNRYDEALEQYRIANTLQSLVYDEKFDILYAMIQMKKGRTEEARLALEKVLQKKETVSVLENLIILLKSSRVQQAGNMKAINKTNKLIAEYYEKLYDKSGDALYLYKLGQDCMNDGRIIEAKKIFYRAAMKLPENSKYKIYARNFALRL